MVCIVEVNSHMAHRTIGIIEESAPDTDFSEGVLAFVPESLWSVEEAFCPEACMKSYRLGTRSAFPADPLLPGAEHERGIAFCSRHRRIDHEGVDQVLVRQGVYLT